MGCKYKVKELEKKIVRVLFRTWTQTASDLHALTLGKLSFYKDLRYTESLSLSCDVFTPILMNFCFQVTFQSSYSVKAASIFNFKRTSSFM